MSKVCCSVLRFATPGVHVMFRDRDDVRRGGRAFNPLLAVFQASLVVGPAGSLGGHHPSGGWSSEA